MDRRSEWAVALEIHEVLNNNHEVVEIAEEPQLNYITSHPGFQVVCQTDSCRRSSNQRSSYHHYSDSTEFKSWSPDPIWGRNFIWVANNKYTTNTKMQLSLIQLTNFFLISKKFCRRSFQEAPKPDLE